MNAPAKYQKLPVDGRTETESTGNGGYRLPDLGRVAVGKLIDGTTVAIRSGLRSGVLRKTDALATVDVRLAAETLAPWLASRKEQAIMLVWDTTEVQGQEILRLPRASNSETVAADATAFGATIVEAAPEAAPTASRRWDNVDSARLGLTPAGDIELEIGPRGRIAPDGSAVAVVIDREALIKALALTSGGKSATQVRISAWIPAIKPAPEAAADAPAGDEAAA